ncbi:hypothetical protein QVD17_10923 [Tagetes erecta]|uniref:Uncharacterized protein n=1 Tax=Tagetes erecta TaxID=13708 RepID=A0AAD8LAA9_TARER|nr:hypothetical protein QVD17_10923 [Tagetes erecta]
MQIGNWCRINPIFAFSFNDFMAIPYSLRGDTDFKKAVHVLFMATTWCVWKHRNHVLFNKITPSVTGVLGDILASVTVWMSTRSRRGGDVLLRNMPHDVAVQSHIIKSIVTIKNLATTTRFTTSSNTNKQHYKKPNQSNTKQDV